MEIIDIALFSLKIVQECHLIVEMVCILKKKKKKFFKVNETTSWWINIFVPDHSKYMKMYSGSQLHQVFS